MKWMKAKEKMIQYKLKYVTGLALMDYRGIMSVLDTATVAAVFNQLL